MSSTTHKYNRNRSIDTFNQMPPHASETMTDIDDIPEADASDDESDDTNEE